MKSLITIVCFLAGLVGGAGAAAARPSVYGFAPAYPADSLPVFRSDRNPPYTAYERPVLIILTVDKNGKVKGVAPKDPSHQPFCAYVTEYLKSLTLAPAENEKKSVESKLPVEVVFNGRGTMPEFVFPIDASGVITNRERFFGLLVHNDIQSPRIIRFPSYFAELHWSDTSRSYPIVFLKLGLDAAGQVMAVDVIRSTLPAGPMTTMSVALWADFAPLTIKGKPKASECFLLVSYYPQVIYPTRTWHVDSLAGQPLLEQWRVHVLPDTVGLLCMPIPRLLTGDLLDPPGRAAVAPSDTASAIFAVDTLGNLHVQRFDTGIGSLSDAVRRLSGEVKFYPARRYDGSPVAFRGRVIVTGTDSGKLRIEYVW